MMKRFFGLALLMVCSVGLVVAQETGSAGFKDSSWYPIKKDSTWTYKISGNAIVMKVTGFDKIGPDNCAKLETIVNGKTMTYEHILVKDDGIYRVTVNGQKPTDPVKFFALPAKAGDSWDVKTSIQNQKIDGKFTTKEEEVKVPAGTFKAISVEGNNFEIAGMKTKLKYWFAENTGIVKLSFNINDQDAVLELEKYEAGK